MIFDQVERTDVGSAKYSESLFSFLNRSARIEAEHVRGKMEEWLSNFPMAERNRLTTTLQSSNDLEFLAAYFELYLLTLLTRMGYSIEVHPEMKSGSKRPDLLVKVKGEMGIYIEAVLASEASQQELGQTARENQVYDILNEMDSPNFFVGLELSGTPATPPPARKIKEQVSKWLKTLDPDAINELHQRETILGLPKLKVDHDGWHITFYPIAKSPAIRGKSGVIPIGMKMTEFEKVKTKDAIRDAIARKATRYGEMDKPYIIAVNMLSPFLDRDKIMDALFGSEQYVFRTDMPNDHPPEMKRARDGVWFGPSGPRNTRVSAVLIVQHLTPWSIASRDMTL